MKRQFRSRLVFGLCLTVLLLLIVYPLGWLLARALSSPEWEFTLGNLREAAAVPRLRQGIFNTLWVSLWTSAISVPLGFGLAFLSVRTQLAGQTLLRLLTISPFLCPPVIASIAWVILADDQGGLINILLQNVGLPLRVNIYSYAGLVFVTSLLSIPLVYLVLEGSMRQVNAELEEQARICGASRLQVLRRVTLSLLLPGITAATLLVFLQSNIHFGIHAPIGMPANIPLLTTLIYTSSMVGPVDLGLASALALILVLLSLGLLVAQMFILAGRSYAVVGGKFRPAKRVPLGPWKYAVLAVVLGYLFCAVILPYGVLFLRSVKPFNLQVGMGLREVFSGWGLSAYRSLWETEAFRRALFNSLGLGLGAAAGCSAMAVACGYLIFRTRIRGGWILHALCLTAPALSGVVVGVAFLFAFGKAPFPLYGTLWILLLAYMAREMAMPLKAVEAPYRQIHADLEEAAVVCGASWAAKARKILLPLIRPALVGGAILVFIASFREIGASAILYSHGSEVVGSWLMVLFHDGSYQSLSALAVVSAGICLVIALLLYVSFGRPHAAHPG